MEPRSFSVDELFTSYIQNRVAGNADQLPVMNFIQNSGHDAGTFVFIRTSGNLGVASRKGAANPPVSPSAPDLMIAVLSEASPMLAKDGEALSLHQRRLDPWRRGHLPEALTAADELVLRYPQDPRQRIARAVLRGLKPDWAGAENDASAALAKLPTRADVLFVRGVARLNDFLRGVNREGSFGFTSGSVR